MRDEVDETQTDSRLTKNAVTSCYKPSCYNNQPGSAAIHCPSVPTGPNVVLNFGAPGSDRVLNYGRASARKNVSLASREGSGQAEDSWHFTSTKHFQIKEPQTLT